MRRSLSRRRITVAWQKYHERKEDEEGDDKGCCDFSVAHCEILWAWNSDL
jgi:hypothetical protein